MKKTILLVEDDIRLSEALKLILEDNNYSVDTANDGRGYLLSCNIAKITCKSAQFTII